MLSDSFRRIVTGIVEAESVLKDWLASHPPRTDGASAHITRVSSRGDRYETVARMRAEGSRWVGDASMKIAAVTHADMALDIARETAKIHGMSIRVYGTSQGLYFVDRLPDPVWGDLTSVVDVYADGREVTLPIVGAR